MNEIKLYEEENLSQSCLNPIKNPICNSSQSIKRKFNFVLKTLVL